MNLPTKNGERTRELSTRTAGAWPDPWTELEQLHRRVERLLWGDGPLTGPTGPHWSPALDLEETDEAYVAEIEMPGVKKDDITVEVVGDELRVHGEIKERERKGILRHQTRRVGVIDHTVTLPGQVDADQVTARLDDGVLTVHAPKSGPQRKRVTVSIA